MSESKILNEVRRQWVAFAPDDVTIVAHAATPQELKEKLLAAGEMRKRSASNASLQRTKTTTSSSAG